MPGRKRVPDEALAAPKVKKTKFLDDTNTGRANDHQAPPSKLTTEEIDFPRGGGTSFTPLEVKAIRAEALQEANGELFKEAKKVRPKKRKSDVKGKSTATATATTQSERDQIRVEHLNYKRITVGMKILGQIVSILPLALVISLPNQLLGHVPITQISVHLTTRLQAMDEDKESVDSGSEEEKEEVKSNVPDLYEIFQPGQYVRAVVTAVHPTASTDTTAIGRTRDKSVKASRRVELSLSPDRINSGVQQSDLRAGFTLSAAVKSVEDHGYILDLGISRISGFLSFKDAKKGLVKKLRVGQLVDATVSKMSGNGRTCTVTVESTLYASSSLSEIRNVTSILPGTLVQSLITAVVPSGLNLQGGCIRC